MTDQHPIERGPCCFCGKPTVEYTVSRKQGIVWECYACTLSLRDRPAHTEARGRPARDTRALGGAPEPAWTENE